MHMVLLIWAEWDTKEVDKVYKVLTMKVGTFSFCICT